MKMKKVRVLNDLRVKSFTVPEDRQCRITKEGKRVYSICGMSTRKYYDSSNPRYRIPSFRLDNIVSLTELAIRFYNIKEHTNFGLVKVLRVVRSLSGAVGFRITFEASSPSGVLSVFVAKVLQRYDEYQTIKIESVKMKRSDSNNNHKKRSPEDLPPNIPQQHTLSEDSLNDVAPYISQCALALYTISTMQINAKKEAPRHDISSVKVVKATKHDAPSRKVVKGKKHDVESTTYLVAFEASLRDEREKVETFETQIYVPTFFPTTIIQFKEIQIKRD
ncbi:uncharacterized protein LOC141672055 [Apium graveolens]|uniref:uncharacterized protein LOC141672055 n=1 Tax=Apium graveolens TaxID=4045 RepID=UPI003D7B465C